jgi:hypothetical protein
LDPAVPPVAVLLDPPEPDTSEPAPPELDPPEPAWSAFHGAFLLLPVPHAATSNEAPASKVIGKVWLFMALVTSPSFL